MHRRQQRADEQRGAEHGTGDQMQRLQRHRVDVVPAAFAHAEEAPDHGGGDAQHTFDFRLGERHARRREAKLLKKCSL